MNTREVIYIDQYAGVGGFARGLMKAGFVFKKHYFSEIDKYASALYQAQFPDAIELGDIRLYKTSKIDLPMDLLFEVYQWILPDAPSRRITNYERFTRLIREWRSISDRIDLITFGFPCQDLSIAGQRKGLVASRSGLFYDSLETVRDFKPDIFIFENVAGLFSSNGGEDFKAVLRSVADIGLYGCQWQLVNTAWFLPQNRERVYFVGILGTAGGYSRAIFPIREDDEEHNGESREGRRKGKWFQETDCCSTIRAKNPDSGTDTFVAVYRYQNKNTGVVVDDIVPTLKASGGTDIRKAPVVKVGTLRTHKDGEGFREMQSGDCSTLNARARQDGSQQPVVAIPVPDVRMKIKDQNGRRIKDDGDPMFTLTNAGTHGVMVYDLKTPSSKTRRGGIKEDESPSLDTNSYVGVKSGFLIRRLTPLECFRLQFGMCSAWVVYRLARKIGISDTQMYKMAGSAVSEIFPYIIGHRALNGEMVA